MPGPIKCTRRLTASPGRAAQFSRKKTILADAENRDVRASAPKPAPSPFSSFAKSTFSKLATIASPRVSKPRAGLENRTPSAPAAPPPPPLSATPAPKGQRLQKLAGYFTKLDEGSLECGTESSRKADSPVPTPCLQSVPERKALAELSRTPNEKPADEITPEERAVPSKRAPLPSPRRIFDIASPAPVAMSRATLAAIKGRRPKPKQAATAAPPPPPPPPPTTTTPFQEASVSSLPRSGYADSNGGGSSSGGSSGGSMKRSGLSGGPTRVASSGPAPTPEPAAREPRRRRPRTRKKGAKCEAAGNDDVAADSASPAESGEESPADARIVAASALDEGGAQAADVATGGTADDTFAADGRELAWWLVLLSPPHEQVLHVMPLLSRRFKRMCDEALSLASLVGCVQPTEEMPFVELSRLLDAYPQGHFLAEGGWKRVFKVLSSAL